MQSDYDILQLKEQCIKEKISYFTLEKYEKYRRLFLEQSFTEKDTANEYLARLFQLLMSQRILREEKIETMNKHFNFIDDCAESAEELKPKREERKIAFSTEEEFQYEFSDAETLTICEAFADELENNLFFAHKLCNKLDDVFQFTRSMPGRKKMLQRMLDFENNGESPRKKIDIYRNLLVMLHTMGKVRYAQARSIINALENSKDTTIGGPNQDFQLILQTTYDLPIGLTKPINNDISVAKKVFSKRIFGMEKAKIQVYEYLTFLQHSDKSQFDPILLYGPPGLGKTSFAKALAEALQTAFVKISCAGLYDNAFLRGSAQSWSGSCPGAFIKELQNCATSNPVILLDEVDKSGGSSAGVIINALAEILDVRQNYSYTDLYLNYPVDLSQCIFVLTANDIDYLPGFLIDRCVRIELDDYNIEEKIVIIQQFLAKDVVQETGLHYPLLVTHDVAEKIAKSSDSLRTAKRLLKSLLARELKDLRGKKENTLMIARFDVNLIDSKGGRKREIGFLR